MELDCVFGGWEEIELNNFISPGVTRWGWREGEEEEMGNMGQRRVGKAQQEAWVLEAGTPRPWTGQGRSPDLILEGGWAWCEGGPVCRWGRARSQGDSHPEACLVRVEGIRVMLFCPRGANTQDLDLKVWCGYPMEVNFNSRKLEGSRKTWSGPERESGNSRRRGGLWGTISDRVSLGSTGCQGHGCPPTPAQGWWVNTSKGRRRRKLRAFVNVCAKEDQKGQSRMKSALVPGELDHDK